MRNVGRRVRRSSSIRSYVGENGGGKSLCAVYDLLPSLAAGRTVLSTAVLLDAATGLPHAHYVPLTSWVQLMNVEHCDVLLDEVTGVASARSYASTPSQLLQLFVQLRKRDVTLSWTTPNYARADVIIREVTRTVTVCRGYFPKVDPETSWPRNRFFRWATYDAIEWEQFSLQQTEKAKGIGVQLFRRSGSEAERSYRTDESCEMLDHMDITGTCLTCGGRKAQHKCGCDPSARVPASEAPEPERIIIPLMPA